MRIAAYIRVSTGRQAEEGMSLVGQLEQIKAFAERGGHQIVEVYEEAGASATDDRRPQFQRMIADAVLPAHPFDAVVVFSQSRRKLPRQVDSPELETSWLNTLGLKTAGGTLPRESWGRHSL
jgi:DNA invertase Pin-like site-specific DNA recombinase